MIDIDKITTLRLPWSVICKLACKATIRKMSLQDVMQQALQERVSELQLSNEARV